MKASNSIFIENWLVRIDVKKSPFRLLIPPNGKSQSTFDHKQHLKGKRALIMASQYFDSFH